MKFKQTFKNTVVDNDTIWRDDISLKAKGLYTLILSVANSGKDITFSDLIRSSKDEHTSTMTAYKELVDKGLITDEVHPKYKRHA